VKTRVGLWIDHKETVIVFPDDNDAEIKRINSNIEKHHRQSGVSTPADIRQRESTEHLNVYYDEVISCIRDAESILILGPGEAKGELRKRLEKNNLGGRIVAIETTDKLTDPQIVAQVREHFLSERVTTTSR
jgi:stalled ribosome rescue protein Dom34